ncbi:hypothetical protein HDU76_009798 [Blyttiomyces sp. JEL0837]|nr:hypothetical protein HDU76_009798 [Blyttiomyces sp. JEL0837]
MTSAAASTSPSATGSCTMMTSSSTARTSDPLNPTFCFPDYLLPIILRKVDYDRVTLKQARLVSHTWNIHATAFVVRNMTLTVENTADIVELIKTWNRDQANDDSSNQESSSSQSTSTWSKYVHYVQVMAPQESHYASRRREARMVFIQWALSLMRLALHFSEITLYEFVNEPVMDPITRFQQSLQEFEIDVTSSIKTFSYNDAQSQIAAMNVVFASMILKKAETLQNLRILNICSDMTDLREYDYTGLENLANLKTAVVNSELPSLSMTLKKIVANSPVGLKRLAIACYDWDLDQFGREPAIEPIKLFQERLQEFEIAVTFGAFETEQYPTFLCGYLAIRSGFKYLCLLSSKYWSRSQHPTLTMTFPVFQRFFDFDEDRHFDPTTYKNVVHLQLECEDIRTIIVHGLTPPYMKLFKSWVLQEMGTVNYVSLGI